jgi:hypothetical protein
LGAGTAVLENSLRREVNMRALDAEGFVAYAQAQIAAAERIQAGHRPSGGFCRCGRLWPCSVVQTCVRTRDHYRARLALLDQTVQLPTIPNPPPEPVRVPRWRRLFTFGRGGGG